MSPGAALATARLSNRAADGPRFILAERGYTNISAQAQASRVSSGGQNQTIHTRGTHVTTASNECNLHIKNNHAVKEHVGDQSHFTPFLPRPAAA